MKPKQARKKAKTIKVRRKMTSLPEVLDYKDHKTLGLIRVLKRADGSNFPEFALYEHKSGFDGDVFKSLKDAGLKEEAKGKWVLRTNKFNIFVYQQS